MNTEPEALLERVRRVPERRRAATHQQAYQNLKQQLDEMLKMLDRADAAERAVTEVFRRTDPHPERVAAGKAIVKLASAFAALPADGDPAGLSDMQKSARHALTALQSATEKTWKDEVGEFTTRYAGMLGLLARMRLPHAAEANAAAGLLRQQAEPPRSDGDRRKVADAVNTIRTLLTRLSGDGDAEPEGLRFLRQVGEGRATAQQLLDPAVQAFLTEHNIWQLLKVTVA